LAIEEADHAIRRPDWFHRWILYGLFPYRQRLRWALLPARAAQRLRLDRLLQVSGILKLLPSRLRRLVEMLPPSVPDDGPLPEILPAIGKKRATVALFTGCVADAMLRHTHWATARVLQHNGCEVHVPPGQACCGAIHLHAGDSMAARKLADQNAALFAAANVDAVITNVAGCGAMMKEYVHHWHGDRQAEREAFAASVRDVSEFLDALGLVPPDGHVRAVATYHDACHLGHAQRITAAPRRLLAHIAGLELRPLPETELCCGAAGTYNILQPEMSDRLSRRKLANIDQTGAQVVITANAGCILQIAAEARKQGKPLQVMHPMDILDLAYRNGETNL
jgi:glycolate oxidase iron-sulfur subunit